MNRDSDQTPDPDRSSPRSPASVDAKLLDSKLEALRRLEEVIETLRGPQGCPWDRRQTLRSLRPNFLEEACEVIDAIETAAEGMEPGSPEVREELGDLLMNIFLAARVAEEGGGFGLAEVARAITDKLVRRHPHVFSGESITDVGGVLARWKDIKAREKSASGSPSVLDGVPRSLPALAAAYDLGRKAAEVGFDWPDSTGALEKIREELAEIDECLGRAGGPDREALEHEVGDLLLAVANFARKLEISPEAALRASSRRFRDRFRYIEDRIKETGPRSAPPTLYEMEALWQEAKRRK